MMSDFDNGNSDDDIKPIDMNAPAAPMSSYAGNAPLPDPIQAVEEKKVEAAAAATPAYTPGEPQNIVKKHDYYDLIKRCPTLKQIAIGVGWEQRFFEEVRIDVDLSLFMLDKTGKTRKDEDFVFYNNSTAFDGSVRHGGDSRTGAGDGDDETVFIDFNGLPFDILRIMFVLSIYDQDLAGHHFGMVRDLYIRLVDREDGSEIIRFNLEEDALNGAKAMYLMCLHREGPKWFFEALGDRAQGDLANVATQYDIIVKELQSTEKPV
jgi:tellurium resistance protein TerD